MRDWTNYYIQDLTSNQPSMNSHQLKASHRLRNNNIDQTWDKRKFTGQVDLVGQRPVAAQAVAPGVGHTLSVSSIQGLDQAGYFIDAMAQRVPASVSMVTLFS
jgi:hypothetical protein